MKAAGPRIRREWRTVRAMIHTYCRGIHRSVDGVCPSCAELMDYAERRLEKCPFQEEKPPCAGCPIHCYQPIRREQVKAVMRYSGPRMILSHPILALRHWLDSFKEAPEHPRKRVASAGSGSPPEAASGTGSSHSPGAGI